MRHLVVNDQEKSFYIFQPKIINKTNIQTYQTIHSDVFQKQYNKIDTLIQSTSHLKLIKKLKKKKMTCLKVYLY